MLTLLDFSMIFAVMNISHVKTRVLMRQFVIIAFFLALTLHGSAQIQWQRSYGGSNTDIANAIIQTVDGGYIVAGTTGSSDGDITTTNCIGWIIKLSPSGSIDWQICVDANVNSIRQTIDSGYIVAGASFGPSSLGDADFCVIKLYASGSIQWQKSLGGSGNDWAKDIRQTPDGGYIVIGETYSNNGDVSGNHGSWDIWVIKLSAAGSIQWQKCYGGSGSEFGNAILVTENGYIIAGLASSIDGDVIGYHPSTDIGSSTAPDCWILKLSASGSIEWQQCLGGGSWDEGRTICRLADSGFVVAGITKSVDGDVAGNHGYYDVWVVKLSALGDVLWRKCFGGNDDDHAYAVYPTSDGGSIIGGVAESNNGDVSGNHGGQFDYWILKLDAGGNMAWQKCLGGTQIDEARSVQQTTDGGYIVAGQSNSNDGDVTGNHGYEDYWVVKLGPKTGIDDAAGTAPVSVSPNPAFNTVYVQNTGKVTIMLYNILGQPVRTAKNADNISVTGLAPGMYFIRLFSSSGELLYQDKIIKE